MISSDIAANIEGLLMVDTYGVDGYWLTLRLMDSGGGLLWQLSVICMRVSG